MKTYWQHKVALASTFGIAACLLLSAHSGGQREELTPHYKILEGTTQGNLTVYPVVAETSFDTSSFITLEEGIRSGQVVVTEASLSSGLIRPRPTGDRMDHAVWRERPTPMTDRSAVAHVNELAIINNSSSPLLLLAGEIVTGGKQDRVVGKDRIIPAHSDPIALGVFCVEPHRWTETSTHFGALHSSMAQPSVRVKAMAKQDQQQVWDEVAKSRATFLAAAPAPEARALQGTSSYAKTMESQSVERQLDSITAPFEQNYQKLLTQLRGQKAVGAIVAVHGEIIWADVFASPALLEKYWPKLIRSYAAEAFAPRPKPTIAFSPATQKTAQDFLDHLNARHENVETEPGLYRNTEINGEDFNAFVLTALLPHTGFNVHIAKMKN